jgi:hypothetical protein
MSRNDRDDRDDRDDAGMGRVSDWQLERLAHGDLPAEQAARLRARLEQEPGGVARLAALLESDREIVQRLPPAVVAAEVRRRLARAPGRRPTPSWMWAFQGLALGAAGLLLVMGGLRFGRQLTPQGAAEAESEVTREKGTKRPHLAVFRKQNDHADRLASGAAVHAGDVVQLAYFSAGRPFGVIVSIDARGTITPHLPAAAAGSAVRLAEPGETLLPSSYELDNSPGFERFVLVTGPAPFATAAVIESLRPGGPPLPPSLSLVDLTLRKETP